MPVSTEIKDCALAAYAIGHGLTNIAARYGVPASTISHWAKSAGMARRKRGAKALATPSTRVKTIMKLSKRMSYRQIAAVVGGSHQNVSEIYQVWLERWWKIEPSFQVGDVIEWFSMRFRVLAVHSHIDGDVQAEDGQIIRNFKWSEGNNRSLLAQATIPAR